MKTATQLLDEVMRRGRRVFHPAFTVCYMRQPHTPKPRIVVGQKVDKRAVVRNKIRRRIRAVLQDKMSTGVGMVVITRKPILGLSYQQLRVALESILNQIK